MSIKKEIVKAISKVTGTKESEINLEIPEDQQFGDFSTNIALVLSNKQSKNSHELGEEFTNTLREEKELLKVIDKVEVAGPGFINFWIKNDVLVDNLIQIDGQKKNYGRNVSEKGKKISIEFTDPNPFKEFHIGHLYSNTIGESLSRLQEAIGKTVWRADYFGDAGAHVAKAIWGLQKKMKDDGVNLDELSKKDLKYRINYMAQGYALGSSEFEKDENIKEEIETLNTVIYLAAQRMWKEKEGRDPIVNYDPDKKVSSGQVEEIYNLYVTGRSWSLEYFEQIYARLGTKFDGYYPETVVGEIGYKYVTDNLGKAFEESEGAIVFKGEKVGLHTRVFINKHKLPTYEAKELGLAPKKYDDFPYDESVIVTGNEINEYFKVLIAALKEVNPKLGNCTMHIGHGMVRLPEGKMSSRTGKVVTAEDVLDEVKGKVSEIVSKTDVFKSEKDEISEKIAIAAVKYSFLKNGIGQDVIFDVEKSLSLEGNSGPYLQYTYARTRSVNAKAEATKFEPNKDLEINNEEAGILRSLCQFSEVIVDAAKNYSPNLICNYLFDLAQKYNSFYNKDKIIGSENENFRLALNNGVGQVLKNGLNLLGIQAPEKM